MKQFPSSSGQKGGQARVGGETAASQHTFASFGVVRLLGKVQLGRNRLVKLGSV